MLIGMQVARILTSYAGILLVCFATGYGPLLHEHPAGELGGGAVIHAHLPGPEQPPPSDQNSIGFHHSHAKAVWLDGLLTTTPPDSPELIAMATARFVIPHLEHVRIETVSVEIPRAHSPPSLDRSTPRSPPA
jgi:hypothetical protein